MEWEEKHNGTVNLLYKEFTFSDFKKALAFINKIGEIAERLNHHPIIWNCYNSVKLELFTHSKGGISSKDYTLAKEIDKLVFYDCF